MVDTHLEEAALRDPEDTLAPGCRRHRIGQESRAAGMVGVGRTPVPGPAAPSAGVERSVSGEDLP